MASIVTSMINFLLGLSTDQVKSLQPDIQCFLIKLTKHWPICTKVIARTLWYQCSVYVFSNILNKDIPKLIKEDDITIAFLALIDIWNLKITKSIVYLIFCFSFLRCIWYDYIIYSAITRNNYIWNKWRYDQHGLHTTHGSLTWIFVRNICILKYFSPQFTPRFLIYK